MTSPPVIILQFMSSSRDREVREWCGCMVTSPLASACSILSLFSAIGQVWWHLVEWYFPNARPLSPRVVMSEVPLSDLFFDSCATFPDINQFPMRSYHRLQPLFPKWSWVIYTSPAYWVIAFYMKPTGNLLTPDLCFNQCCYIKIETDILHHGLHHSWNPMSLAWLQYQIHHLMILDTYNVESPQWLLL